MWLQWHSMQREWQTQGNPVWHSLSADCDADAAHVNNPSFPASHQVHLKTPVFYPVFYPRFVDEDVEGQKCQLAYLKPQS